MASNDILLSAQVCPLLSHHQRIPPAGDGHQYRQPQADPVQKVSDSSWIRIYKLEF